MRSKFILAILVIVLAGGAWWGVGHRADASPTTNCYVAIVKVFPDGTRVYPFLGHHVRCPSGSATGPADH